MVDYPDGISRTLTQASYGIREPHRVAIVQDWGVGLQPLYDQYDATQLALEEAFESGLLDRPVELEVVECGCVQASRQAPRNLQDLRHARVSG